MLDPQRGFGHITDFTDQSVIANGTADYLARVKLAGNLVCEKPNGSIYLSAMS